MGKFADTKYINTVDNLIEASKSKLINPYYPFGDQKPSKVTYYAQNIEKSTLDESSGLYEAHLGKNSPFKFNKIKDFVLYGIDRIETDYDVGDNGVEAASITGDAVVLPNTIVPRPGDFFSIPYIKENILFKVNGVTPDTLDTGANFYKIEYSIELTNTIDTIESQVIKVFNFITGNVGTDFKAIIESSDFEIVITLESLVEELITYFENVFFDQRLQTFVYNHDGWHMYDPFMIEFLMRNSVLKYGDKYIYVSHATYTDKTFGMDYIKTLFYSLENPDETVKFSNFATADLIDDPNSLFVTRLEEYYKVKYFDKTPKKTRFQIFNTDLVERIKSGEMFEKGDDNECYNLWISYFNNFSNFDASMLEFIKRIDYMDNLNCFYMLGISIFIIEQYIKFILK